MTLSFPSIWLVRTGRPFLAAALKSPSMHRFCMSSCRSVATVRDISILVVKCAQKQASVLLGNIAGDASTGEILVRDASS